MHSTCVDSLHSPGIKISHHLIHSFLEHGICITSSSICPTSPDSCQYLVYWATQYPDAPECSEPMKAMILKSEDALRNMIAQNEEVTDLVNHRFPLYQVANLFEWVQGCKILLEKGARLRHDGHPALPLLICAATSLNIDAVRFWINIGPALDNDELQHVGFLESALLELGNGVVL